MFLFRSSFGFRHYSILRTNYSIGRPVADPARWRMDLDSRRTGGGRSRRSVHRARRWDEEQKNDWRSGAERL